MLKKRSNMRSFPRLGGRIFDIQRLNFIDRKNRISFFNFLRRVERGNQYPQIIPAGTWCVVSLGFIFLKRVFESWWIGCGQKCPCVTGTAASGKRQ